MDGIELKKIWRMHQPSFGAWVTSTDPTMVAEMCHAGYDWLLIDTEHHVFNPESLRNIIMIMLSRGVAPIVRVVDNDTAIIKKTLDMGAEGILVPLIGTAEDARRAVAACKYPPEGMRGWCPVEASDYFHNIDYYNQTINQRVVVMLQIESIDAVNNIDSILDVQGIDCLMIGPADLSYSLGFPLRVDQPEVQEVINTVITKANAADIPIGIFNGSTVKEFEHLIKRGINILVLCMDHELLGLAARDILVKMREITGER